MWTFSAGKSSLVNVFFSNINFYGVDWSNFKEIFKKTNKEENKVKMQSDSVAIKVKDAAR